MQHEGASKKQHEGSRPSVQQEAALEDLYSSQNPVPAIVQRAHTDPRGLQPRDIMRLQRTIGNQAVSRLLTQSPQPVQQAVPGNNIQRMIIELWNINAQTPNKRPWNTYSQLIARNWPGIGNDLIARPIVNNLIKTLNTQAQLDLMANSTAITKKIYDNYADNVWYLFGRIENGATRNDLENGMLVEGERGRVNADNLNWLYQNHQNAVQLNWREWFPYTHKQQWDPPTHDAEIGVSIGGTLWGLIHIHYPRYADAAEINEQNINTIHIKREKWSDDKYILGADWKARCQAIIDQKIGDRPVLQHQQIPMFIPYNLN